MPKPSPLTNIQKALDDLDAAAAQAAKLLTPVAKKLGKLLAGLDLAKLPPGAAADLMYLLNQSSKVPGTALASFEDVFAPYKKTLTEHFINTLAAGESSGVQGLLGRVQITTSSVPTVNDWPAFYAYVGKTKGFDLLNRAVNVAAVRERWDVKKQVPGVGTFVAKKVSCTRLGGK